MNSCLAKPRSHDASFPLCVWSLLDLAADVTVFLCSPTSVEQAWQLTGPWDPMQAQAWYHVSGHQGSLDPGHPAAGRGLEMLPASALTLCWGSDSSAPVAARDEKQPFPLPNFSTLRPHIACYHGDPSPPALPQAFSPSGAFEMSLFPP